MDRAVDDQVDTWSSFWTLPKRRTVSTVAHPATHDWPGLADGLMDGADDLEATPAAALAP